VIYAIRGEAQHGLRRFISTIITQSTNLGTKQETFESIPRNLTGNKDSFQRPRLFPIEYRLPQLGNSAFQAAKRDERQASFDPGRHNLSDEIGFYSPALACSNNLLT